MNARAVIAGRMSAIGIRGAKNFSAMNAEVTASLINEKALH